MVQMIGHKNLTIIRS